MTSAGHCRSLEVLMVNFPYKNTLFSMLIFTPMLREPNLSLGSRLKPCSKSIFLMWRRETREIRSYIECCQRTDGYQLLPPLQDRILEANRR